MKRWLAAIPVAVLVVFGILAASRLMDPEKGDFERVLRNAPDRTFDTLDGGSIAFSPTPTGTPVIVNLFASWCAPCEAEHRHVAALSEAYPGQVFGVLYKDKVAAGQEFLNRMGNPYTRVALDPDGQGGLDFGLTGVPETFVISASGEILLHINKPLTETSAKKIGEALKSAPPT